MTSSTNIGAHIAYALQLSLGIIFLTAVWPKLRHPSAFAATVAGYRLVPVRLVRWFAWGLIATESFLAFAFLSGSLVAVAVPLAVVSVCGFVAAVTVNLRRGNNVPCGCFGDATEEISRRSLVRLGALLLAVAALVVVSKAAGSPIGVTLGSVTDRGVNGFKYLIEIAGLASFLILVGMWVLSLPELAWALGRRATATDDPTEAAT